MGFLLQGGVVFAAVAFADVCWARYVGATASKKRWRAALWAAGIYVMGSFSVIEYTGDHRLLVPAVLGSFFGTLVGVKPASGIPER